MPVGVPQTTAGILTIMKKIFVRYCKPSEILQRWISVLLSCTRTCPLRARIITLMVWRSLFRKKNVPEQPEDFPADRNGMIPLKGAVIKAYGRQNYDPVEFRIYDKEGRLVIWFTGSY
jgi:hypothetical protein